MSWKKNAMMQSNLKALNGKEEYESSNDSRILRYIKTLTSHQTNAKQQRMDKYLQQVKRQPEEDFALKPPTLKAPRQEAKFPVPLKPGTWFKKEEMITSARKKQPTGDFDLKTSRGTGNGGENDRRPSVKREYEGERNHQPRKRSKRVPLRQQNNAAMGSLNRFRFNGSKLAGAAEQVAGSRLETTPAENKTGNKLTHLKEPFITSRQGPPPREDKPKATKLSLQSIDAGLEHVTFDAPHAQKLPSEFFKTFTEPITAEDEPPRSSSQNVSVKPPKDMQPEDFQNFLPSDQVFIYDPLCSIMESIYF